MAKGEIAHSEQFLLLPESLLNFSTADVVIRLINITSQFNSQNFGIIEIPLKTALNDVLSLKNTLKRGYNTFINKSYTFV